MPRKLLALQVELCELANETRCFKYWSKKPSASRDAILGEYVDVVHFVLSICFELGVTEVGQLRSSRQKYLTAQFSYMLRLVCQISGTRAEADVQELFAALLDLGSLLGFDEQEIERAYLHKNNVNHERQQQGY